jgi:hypothetical protein
MRKLLLGIAVCTLLACSDGKDKITADAGPADDAGPAKPDAAKPGPDPEDDAEVAQEDAAPASALERPPEALERPPTRLPDDLRPPR